MTVQEQLYHDTQVLTGFPLGAVEKAAQSLSAYTRHLIELETYEPFRWPHVGVFRVKDTRLEKLGLTRPQL